MTTQKPRKTDATPLKGAALPPEKRYRCRLNTLSDVKKEMGRLYREARTGVVDVQEATKLVWCLQAIGKVVESSDIERRIQQLEAEK